MFVHWHNDRVHPKTRSGTEVAHREALSETASADCLEMTYDGQLSILQVATGGCKSVMESNTHSSTLIVLAKGL